jgi:hypothetical protein
MWKFIISEILILAAVFVIVFILWRKARKTNIELKAKKAELDNLLFSIHETIADGYENHCNEEAE